MSDFARCRGCNELFEVRADDPQASRHTEVGLSGLRNAESINLCPACETDARVKGRTSAPPVPTEASEDEPEAAS